MVNLHFFGNLFAIQVKQQVTYVFFFPRTQIESVVVVVNDGVYFFNFQTKKNDVRLGLLLFVADDDLLFFETVENLAR